MLLVFCRIGTSTGLTMKVRARKGESFMEEIIKEAEFLLEQEKADVAELEELLEKLRKIKEKNHPDKFAGLNVS